MRQLLDHGLIHGDCMTVTGKTVAENLQHVDVRSLYQDPEKVYYIPSNMFTLCQVILKMPNFLC